MTNKMAKSAKQNISPLAVRKKILNICGSIFRYVLLICLGFVILTPILKVLKEAISDQAVLGLKNSAWIPSVTSLQTLLESVYILKYPKALAFSLINSAVLALLQTMCAAFAAYSFARLKFKGSNILFGLVIFSIIVPPDSIMLAQYINFRNFDIFGIVQAISGQPLNLIGSTTAIYILAATGMGVKGGLFIYILRQSYRQFPISIEEAAYVDGAGFLKTFIRIVLPGVSASLTTVFVLGFIWNYADTYYISLLSPTNMHLSLRLMRIQRNMSWTIKDIETLMPDKYLVQSESPLIQTAVANGCALLTILPLLVLYMFVQKRFVQGVERSGLGGD